MEDYSLSKASGCGRFAGPTSWVLVSRGLIERARYLFYRIINDLGAVVEIDDISGPRSDAFDALRGNLSGIATSIQSSLHSVRPPVPVL